MSQELYQSGFESGRASASAYPAAIAAIKGNSEALACLAGRRLDECRRRCQERASNYVIAQDWGRGFFDGFMERADQMQESAPCPEAPDAA